MLVEKAIMSTAGAAPLGGRVKRLWSSGLRKRRRKKRSSMRATYGDALMKCHVGRWIALVLVGLLVLDGGSLAQQTTAPAGVVPDPSAFYAAVRENLARAQSAAHLFSYKERRTNLHTNPFGKLGTDGVELWQVYPSTHPKLTYRRLLMRDGVPLSDQELAKQDREYQKRARDVRRRLDDESADERRRREAEEALARQRARMLVEDIVSALEFTITGESVRDGSAAISVAFRGKSTARPTTREGKIAQKFAGTVWVHRDLLEVMHVEAKATDEISFGFGIVARLSKGTTGSLTRKAIEERLWMPTAVRLSGQGRAMLFLRKLTIDYAIDWFDYQRFDGSVPVAG